MGNAQQEAGKKEGWQRKSLWFLLLPSPMPEFADAAWEKRGFHGTTLCLAPCLWRATALLRRSGHTTVIAHFLVFLEVVRISYTSRINFILAGLPRTCKQAFSMSPQSNKRFCLNRDGLPSLGQNSAVN